MELNEKWQRYFADIAVAVSKGSQDASTKVGAVIYRPDKSIVSCGFNGLPRGMPDLPEILNNRELKYPRMVHAECNALYHSRESLSGYGIVVTAHPCSRCALALVASGIKTIYYIPGLEKEERWAADMALAADIIKEAGANRYQIN